MSKEAMKLALEALKELVAQTDGSLFAVKHDHVALQNARQAITALRKALANEALDKMAENARELGLDYEPAKDNSNYRFDPPGLDPSHQKPVTPTAVEMQNASANLALMREMWGNSDEPAAKVNDDGFIVETGLLLSPGTQLYTSPPAQRKPLTVEKILHLVDTHVGAPSMAYPLDSSDWINFARAIEAAHGIKENT